RALSLARESIQGLRKVGAQWGVAGALVDLAGIAAVGPDPESAQRATRLLGAAQAVCDAHGSTMFLIDSADQRRFAATLRAALGEEAFAAAWEAGRTLTLEQAVAETEQVSVPEQPHSPADAGSR